MSEAATCDLSEFDQQAAPKGEMKVEHLPNGQYVLEFSKKGFMKQTTGKGTKIVGCKCLVVKSPDGKCDGASTEKAWFLTDQAKFNGMLEDLGKLGFDTENWKAEKNRPASGEVPRAIELFEGIRWAANKTNSGNFHELQIVGRAADDLPKRFGEQELAAVVLNPF